MLVYVRDTPEVSQETQERMKKLLNIDPETDNSYNNCKESYEKSEDLSKRESMPEINDEILKDYENDRVIQNRVTPVSMTSVRIDKKRKKCSEKNQAKNNKKEYDTAKKNRKRTKLNKKALLTLDEDLKNLPKKIVHMLINKNLLCTVNSNKQNQEDGEGTNNERSVVSIPEDEADPDGTILVTDDKIRVRLDWYAKAAYASDMHKRCNMIVNSMWSIEERAKLTVDRYNRTGYVRITDQQIKDIQNLCMHLQGHQFLRVTKNPTQFNEQIRTWLSMKLRSDRYHNNKNNKSNTNIKKSRKNKRRNIISSDSETEDIANHVISQQLEPIDTEEEKYSRLKSIVENFCIGLHENCNYTWTDILNVTKYKDGELRGIMTSDSHAVVDGKTCIPTIEYKNELVKTVFGSYDNVRKKKIGCKKSIS